MIQDEDFDKSESYLGLHHAMNTPPIGVQKWIAPSDGVFTLIAKGASGGHGRLSRKSSHAAVVTAIIKLNKGEVLYVLVGQEGESACVHNGVETREGLCSQMGIEEYRAKRWAKSETRNTTSKRQRKKKRRQERSQLTPASVKEGGSRDRSI